MKTEQFTYTGSPWGYTPGWTVFQHTPGLDPREASGYMPYYKFCGSGKDGKQGEGSGGPLQYVYVGETDGGGWLMCQTVDAGRRWYDPGRGHDYFAHVWLGRTAERRAEAGWGGAGFNPLAWHASPAFQRAFPEELKEHALKVRDRELPNTPPPELEAREFPEKAARNPRFEDHALFGRLTPGQCARLGAIAGALTARHLGEVDSPLAFDAEGGLGLDTMAAALRLAPVEVRRKAVFTTWAPPEASPAFPEAGRMLFFGTSAANAGAEAETGVSSPGKAKGPALADAKEAERFRAMLDACGESLGAADWDKLVECWDVTRGDKAKDTEALRKTGEMLEKYPQLRAGVESALAATLKGLAGKTPQDWGEGESHAGLVAHFELGLWNGASFAKAYCRAALKDEKWMGEAVAALQGGKKDFLAMLSTEAKNTRGGVADLAKTWKSVGQNVRRQWHGVNDADWPDLFGSLEKLQQLIDGAPRVAAPDAANKLDELQEVAGRLGVDDTEVDGLEDAKKMLREKKDKHEQNKEYEAALDQLKRDGVKGLAAFFSRVGALDKGAKASLGEEAAVLSRLDFEKMSPADLVAAAKAFREAGKDAQKLFVRFADPKNAPFRGMSPREMVDALAKFREAGMDAEVLLGLEKKVWQEASRFLALSGLELLRILAEYANAELDTNGFMKALFKHKFDEGWNAGMASAGRRVKLWLAMTWAVAGLLVGAGGMWLAARIPEWLDGRADKTGPMAETVGQARVPDSAKDILLSELEDNLSRQGDGGGAQDTLAEDSRSQHPVPERDGHGTDFSGSGRALEDSAGGLPVQVSSQLPRTDAGSDSGTPDAEDVQRNSSAHNGRSGRTDDHGAAAQNVLPLDKSKGVQKNTETPSANPSPGHAENNGASDKSHAEKSASPEEPLLPIPTAVPGGGERTPDLPPETDRGNAVGRKVDGLWKSGQNGMENGLSGSPR